MRKLLFTTALAALALPSAALADHGKSKTNPSRLCKQQRTTMGAENFKAFYGGRSNAFGRCVSAVAREQRENRTNAAKTCKAQQSDPNYRDADGKSFSELYGTGRNAYGKCVSRTARSAHRSDQRTILNAAKECKSQARHGRGRNHENSKNAFGKCVSARVRARNEERRSS